VILGINKGNPGATFEANSTASQEQIKVLTKVEYHDQEYKRARTKHETLSEYQRETHGQKITLIRDRLKHAGIPCEKYNYTFDEHTKCPGT
jgi:hypothetical protein